MDRWFMKNWKIFLTLFMVFAAGIGVGVFGTRIVIRKFLQEAVANPDSIRTRMERELVRELRLNPEQSREVRTIMIEAHDQIREVRREVQPQVTAIVESAEKKIADKLNAEQKKRFDEFIAKRSLFHPRNVPLRERK
jgi:hypothetical protein